MVSPLSLRLGLLSTLILLFDQATAQNQTCKCLPGNSCFPDSGQWDSLSRNLSNPVIQNQRPLASVCYTDSPDSNPSACAEAMANANNPAFLSDHSNTVQMENNEELVLKNGTVENCPFNPAPGTKCAQGRVPMYAILAESVSDVQETVRFVRQHNLHLVVKNSGHDFLGRSFGVGSVELYTRNLKNLTFATDFVPQGSPEGSAGSDAVTVGSGVSWGELYAAAEDHNRSVAGGFSPGGTVGAAGGWISGGGHSVLSPFFGLGVDNVLEVGLVLPNASYIIANTHQNPDIFWAIRGGGGPSFGIITTLTYKTHPRSPYTTSFFTASANSTTSYQNLLRVWMQHHNAVADAGWTGLWPFTDNQLFLTLFSQADTPDINKTNSTLEAFFGDARGISGVNVTLATSRVYPSFFAYYQDQLQLDSTGAIGFNFTTVAPGSPHLAISSWMMPRTMTESNNAEALANVFVNFTAGTGFLVGGGVVASEDAGSASVNPVYRQMLTDMTLTPPWDTNITNQANYERAHAQVQPLKALMPEGGQYYNEPDRLEDDWQNVTWRDNYPRLLAIKKQIDPEDVFIVYHGVNSEGWDQEILCKTA